MNDTITVIYEHGVLRPVLPLPLPENARFQVRIVHSHQHATKALAEKQRIYEALLEAGLIEPLPAVVPGPTISEQDLVAAAKALGMAGPLSELILSERDESYGP